MVKNNFTKNYKLYVFYYILSYIFILGSSGPTDNVEMWKFYFPFKSIICALAIEFANAHEIIFRTAFYAEEFDYKRLFLVMAIAFFFNIFVLGVLVCLLRFYTGIDLWFIFI
ncbi:MAG: hypothetical protein Q4E98_03300 [Acidaminococcaceae bacterium]|uniref:hypothetical protein n=1 Tax=uncultured Phascolarctobacterium sp. TaxID=512296 RepID=UPI0025F7242E|nr:hypothetical protein [uncultured Phascolarctobacterium sp.]MDO5379886.1 hypothetical protein [Acidaminococcaceae bacterium]